MSLRIPVVVPARAAGLAAVALGLSIAGFGCMATVQVRTRTAPDANLSMRRTFRLLPTPPAQSLALDSNDPMLDNSITNREIRQHLRAAFESRGYQLDESNPDVTVAYYASTKAHYDVRTWNYGYTWGGWPREYTDVTAYEQGTVIIDVVDPKVNQLLWRGQGVAAVSTDPDVYDRELGRAVNAIVAKYPQATRASSH